MSLKIIIWSIAPKHCSLDIWLEVTEGCGWMQRSRSRDAVFILCQERALSSFPPKTECFQVTKGRCLNLSHNFSFSSLPRLSGLSYNVSPARVLGRVGWVVPRGWEKKRQKRTSCLLWKSAGVLKNKTVCSHSRANKHDCSVSWMCRQRVIWPFLYNMQGRKGTSQISTGENIALVSWVTFSTWERTKEKNNWFRLCSHRWLASLRFTSPSFSSSPLSSLPFPLLPSIHLFIPLLLFFKKILFII